MIQAVTVVPILAPIMTLIDSASVSNPAFTKLTTITVVAEEDWIRAVINTPVTLEFLGLNERALVTENDLEQSILDNLQHFLLEMGHGFCFEARQKRILIDEDYFFADLVFYHRILKCHIIVELKIDKFRHEYASQLNMYLNYFKAEVMQPDDNPPIGILLCTEKGDTLVKYATAGLDPNIFVQKYMIELPSEEEIKEFIASSNY